MTEHSEPTGPSLDRLRTVAQMAEQYPHLFKSEASLRWLIFNAETNGFDTCLVRMGRRVFIDTQAVTTWLRGGGKAEAKPATRSGPRSPPARHAAPQY